MSKDEALHGSTPLTMKEGNTVKSSINTAKSYIRKIAKVLLYIKLHLVFIAVVFLYISCSSGGATRQNRSEEEKLTLRLGQDFEKAERYISRGLFPEALAVVQSIINDHANTLHSDKAYFMKGSIYTNMLNFNRDIEKAAAAFRMVLASGPESEFDKKARAALDSIKNVRTLQ